MTFDEALEILRGVARRHGMYDASWIVKLDEFDEPPLYYRSAEIRFLREVDRSLRGPLAVRWAVEVLDAHADVLGTLSNRNEFLLYITFQDWDLWEAGEQLIPQPCVFVDPRAGIAGSPRFQLVAPTTKAGRTLQDWARELGRADLLVAEPPDPDSIYYRAYLGFRNPPGFLSVNTYFAEE